MRARSYLASHRRLWRLLHALRAIHDGVWLGLLDDAERQAATDLAYGSWRTYSSADHNLRGLEPWEEAAIEDHFAGCRRLLVGAAGGGREVLALERRGFEVVGFDGVPELVAEAGRLLADHGATSRVVAAPGHGVPPGLGTFDGALIGWGGYMHVPGRERRVAVLDAYRSCLRPGAPLLLSFFTRPERSASLRTTYLVARGVAALTRRGVRVELGDTLDRSFDHRFTRGEIEAELRAGGFRLLGFRERPYGHAVAVVDR